MTVGELYGYGNRNCWRRAVFSGAAVDRRHALRVIEKQDRMAGEENG